MLEQMTGRVWPITLARFEWHNLTQEEFKKILDGLMK